MRERKFGDTCCDAASLCIAWKNNANANTKLYNLTFLTMRTIVRWINDGLTLIDFNFHFTILNGNQYNSNLIQYELEKHSYYFVPHKHAMWFVSYLFKFIKYLYYTITLLYYLGILKIGNLVIHHTLKFKKHISEISKLYTNT